MALTEINLVLNGQQMRLWVRPNQTLLDTLRDEAGATDVKYGCGEGVCGTCTVLFDGEAINACLMFGVQADGHEVTTVRGLPAKDEDLHPLQQAFLETGAAQCGYCTPGMLLAANDLLTKNARPTPEEIRVALSGNLCRCTGYSKIVEAISAYASGGGTHSR